MNSGEPIQVTVSVIVPIYNNARALPPLLDSLMKQTVSPEEIIIVDDGSTDNGGAIAASYAVFFLTKLEKNSGPSVARNHGALVATKDILMFLDSDVVLPPQAVEVVKRAFASRRDLQAMNGFMEKEPLNINNPFAKYKALVEYGWSQSMPDWDDSSQCINARIGAVKREAFFEAGGFNPGYKKPSVEDHEFGLRFREKYPIYSCRGLTAFHDFSGFRDTCCNYFLRTSELLQLLWMSGKSKNQDKGGASGRSMMEFLCGFACAGTLPFLWTFAWPVTVAALVLFVFISFRPLRYHLKYGGFLFYLFSLALHMIYGCVVVVSGICTFIGFKILGRRTIPEILRTKFVKFAIGGV